MLAKSTTAEGFSTGVCGPRKRDVSPRGREYLRRRLDELESESYWDSHPALSNRLKAVAAYPNFVIDDHQPALDLLGDSQALIKILGAELASILPLPGKPVAAGG